MFYLNTLSRKVIFFTLAIVCSYASLQACTGIKLTAQDGSVIHGRTLEFGIKIDISMAFIPRNYEFSGTTTQGTGLKYRSKYASVGAISYNNPAILDGINEKGLSVGTFYFPGFAAYSDITSVNISKALSPVEFPNWILTQFASVEDVKAALKNVVIAPTIIHGWGNTPPPFHYVVYEKSGKSIVIEPVGGKLAVYDNPLGIITNSPGFDWHMTNLRNYINLTPFNVEPLKVAGIVLAPFGQGSGMVGLPGDFTPPSRFVSATIFSITATPTANANDAVFQAFHILNQFDIPVGIAREKSNNVTYTDYTLLTCVRNPQSLKFFFKTYDNQSIRMVDLTKFDFNGKTIKLFDVWDNGNQGVHDITAKLK